ncbi:MAG TPA: HAMP domain-containing sensor histidine kinase [Candidatus Limnocylindrales bacterium]|nr:HAMP domain-containing sensor histidine kinase [Candidatus Limnocylindrales bacterium]
MPAASEPTPLAVATLGFVGRGVTSTELVAQFAGVGATIDETTATVLLDELCDLGLTRVVEVTDGRRHYFSTPLGERLLRASFVGREDRADLLAELEQMRSDLISTIAHELRTPLTAVRTSIGLLVDPTVEPTADQRRSLLEAVDRNASRMQRVVEDILELARFRVGRVQLQLRRFDAIELARTAISSIAPLAESREQRIELDAPSDPVWMFGDYRRLEQALVNLLSNAEKYSPNGAPIQVTVASTDDSVSWTVADEGRGIKPHDRARLFERFFVVQLGRSDVAPGVGLGLPITLAIVQAHDGRIDVESEPGRGSTFTIVVPAAGPKGGFEE